MARRKRFNRIGIPLIILVVCILAFGLLIPRLGFYWDDWFVVFYTHAGRSEYLFTHYSYDRPYSTWTALLGGALLGTSPILWQIAALLIRWLAVLAMWWALRAVWPKRPKELAWLALIFAVYPAFFLQPISVALSQHWIAYALFFLSLGAMGWAQRRPEQARPLTALALAAELLHLLTLEYFAGLELIRPLYLYILLAQSGKSPRNTFKSALRAWAPYLALWIAWVLWRMFLLDFPVEPHPPQLLLDFLETPAETLTSFIQLVIANLGQLLIIAWRELYQWLFGRPHNLFATLATLAGLATGLGAYYLSRTALQPEDEPPPDGSMALWSVGLGLVSIVFGLIPIWLIGETDPGAGYNERFALPAMLGAALVWMGLLWGLLRSPRARALLLSLVLGLLVAGHIRATSQFVSDWQTQRAYYEQLKWRAPAIEPDTAFIIFEPESAWMPTPSSTSAAINTLYPQSRASNTADYWFFETRRSARMRQLEDGEILKGNYRGMQFAAQDAGSLLFLYQAEGGCLWMLSPLDVHNEYLPTEQRDKLALANLSRIHASEDAGAPPAAIFGDLAPDGWCYYFEKADLARQFGDWDRVLELMAEAESQNLGPNYGLEWLPLLVARAHVGDWAGAEALSSHIHEMDKLNDPMLCEMWDQFFDEGGLGPEGKAARRAVRQLASCK